MSPALLILSKDMTVAVDVKQPPFHLSKVAVLSDRV